MPRPSHKGIGKKFYVRRVQIIDDKNGFIDGYQLVGQKEFFEEGRKLQREISESGDTARKYIPVERDIIVGNDPKALCEHCKTKKQFHACNNGLCCECDGDLNFAAAHDAYIYRNE